MIKRISLIIGLLLLMQSVTAQSTQQDIFGELEGTFVLYDVTHDTMTIYNPDRAFERFSPFSTYKVPHALIALQSGTAPDENYVIPYNETRYPYHDLTAYFYSRQQWTDDHTLQTATELSIVWYYQEMAGQIGQETMQRYLDDSDYGNRDVSSWLGETSSTTNRAFWLGGSLEISAVEQVNFWRAMYQRDLNLSDNTIDTVLDIITLYETDDYRLYGKTGTRAGDLGLAWFMGIIEQGDDVYIFGFNVAGTPIDRSRILRRILVDGGYMPASSPLFQS